MKLMFSILVGAAQIVAAEISYNRDVRPILSDACFHCHGPDKGTRKPKSDPMRLDTFEGATQDQGGYSAVVPGKPEKSELITRIFAEDKDDLMPPPDSHRSLTKAQKETLRQWIKEGAKYEKHWAFEPPQKTSPPDAGGSAWVKNEIDQFVLQRLAQNKLQPNDGASKETLIRRATLSLTGLQPTPQEVDNFLADQSPNAYEQLLDRLLASPRYGEHMAYGWIEAARYADTDGYQNDAHRNMWPWRDWVIKAYNDNMPYDQFTIRQLAGDMLPNKTPQDTLASAFNRNHRINNEGGALPEEFIVEYAVDRVETTSTIWLGLTAGCARCHDHKYDPLSQKQFFQLYAYFNSIGEKGKDAGAKASPHIAASSPIYRDLKTQKQLAALESELVKTPTTAAYRQRQRAWEKKLLENLSSKKSPWRLARSISANVEPLQGAPQPAKLVAQPDDSWLTDKPSTNSRFQLKLHPPTGMKQISTLRLDALQHSRLKPPLRFSHTSGGNFFLTELTLEILRGDQTIPVSLGQAKSNFSQIYHSVKNITDGKPNTGWAVGGYRGKKPLTAHIPLTKPTPIEKGDILIVTLQHNHVTNPTTKPPSQALAHFRVSFHPQSNLTKTNAFVHDALVQTINTPVKQRTAEQSKMLSRQYLEFDPEILKLRQRRNQAQKKLSAHTVTVPVMHENPKPTPTYLLKRGQYHSPDTSEVLQRSLPPWLNPDKNQPTNRLELARWLVSNKNPLTARVTVNRVWQRHFGTGLVKTADNFGLQGELPSHPKLLDWLAIHFMESGWDLKHLHKLILSSATWRQSSHATPEAYRADPDNRHLARGPRFRLHATAIRDTALYAGGLLHEQLGGPPVKPYQPKGLWNSMAHAPNVRYVPSKGQALYRRDLYTYWKRAVNPPRMVLFDAASRDYCSVLRTSTNTPLQALTTMNDLTFVEAARGLASRMLSAPAQGAEAKLIHGFRLALGRHPTAKETTAIKACFKDFWNYYHKKPDQAAAYIKHGSTPPNAAFKPTEFASYMATAHLMLNMDSTLHIE